jgi:methylmalonyl-CoA mutase, N-terminal domain
VEALTDRMEEAAYAYFRRIDELGGMVQAIKQNFPQREIADASFQYQQEVDDNKRIVVGVNRYQVLDDAPIEILRIDPKLEKKQVDRVKAVRGARDSEAAEAALTALKQAASGDQNLMDLLLDCARAHVTEGEIVEALQTVFGTYTETPVF